MNDTTSTDEYFQTLSPHDSQLLEAEESLWIYYGTFLIVSGTIGHLLTLGVILSSSSMRTQSSSVYIVTLSLAGIVSIYTGLLRFVISSHTNWTVNIKDFSDFACKLHTTLSYFSLQYFAWLQATIAVDRLLAVRRPHWYLHSCGWKVGLFVVLVELISCAMLNIIVAFMVGKKETFCTRTNLQLYNAWPYIDFLSFSLIPATILIICNGLILYHLGKKRTISTNNKLVSIKQDKNLRSVTVMLMTLNLVFLISTLPVSAIYFIDWNQFHYYSINLVYTVFSLLQYTGTALTFVIYCLSGSKFRAKLQTFVTQRKCKTKHKTLRGRSYHNTSTKEMTSEEVI